MPTQIDVHTCTDVYLSLSLFLSYTHTHMVDTKSMWKRMQDAYMLVSHTHTHTHTHAHIDKCIQIYMSNHDGLAPVHMLHSVSLSLSHTHPHTHTHT